MATGSTDPFADLLTLQRDMDRIMARFGAQPRGSGENGHAFWMPPVDVFKQGDDMVVRVELPGVNPSDINVSVTGNMLTIKGERRQDQNRTEGDYVMQESSYGAFERRITMPEDIDASQVRAQYRGGILEVTIPGSALMAARPQKVQIAGTQAPGMGGQQQQHGQPQQQYGEPQQQQQYGQQGGYPQQGAAQQAQQAGTQEQRPVEVQGGWVVPQQTQQSRQQEPQAAAPSPQQTGTPYPAEQPRQSEQPAEEEPKRRSRLGGWFHGEEQH